MLLSALATMIQNDTLKYTINNKQQLAVMQAICMRAFYLSVGTYGHLWKADANILDITPTNFRTIHFRCITGLI